MRAAFLVSTFESSSTNYRQTHDGCARSSLASLIVAMQSLQGDGDGDGLLLLLLFFRPVYTD